MTRRTPPSLLLTLLLLPVLLLAPLRASAAIAQADSVAAPPGPGWYLTDVSRAHSQKLVLVSPTGETSTVYERKVARVWGGFLLLDWSADGRTALLSTTDRHGSQLVRVDVTTGAVLELPVPRLDAAVLDADGSGVIARTWKRERSDTRVLDKISWTGTRTRLLDSAGGSMVLGHNGTLVTGDGTHGRVQVLLSTTTGAVLDRFRPGGYCTAVRWWDATRLLETCGSDLYLVDPATGSTDRLTHGHRHAAGDYGHMDAREAGDRLYVQVAGACGTTFVGHQTKRGEMRHLRVPGAVGNVVMVDAVGKDLVIEHAASCDGDRPRSVLSRFDPIHHEETPLVKLRGRESFGRILVFGEVRASQF
jgi:hypothetical protein